MKNWALTNWLDWFERQREGRARKATLEPCRADRRGPHQRQRDKTKSGSSVRPIGQGRSSGGGGGRWGGGDRSYRCTKNLVTSQCVTGTLSPSTTPSQIPKAAFLVLHLPPSAPRPLVPLPGTKRSSPTSSSPTRVRAGKPVWEPQGARILLESGKSLNQEAPESDPYPPNTQDERNM